MPMGCISLSRHLQRVANQSMRNNGIGTVLLHLKNVLHILEYILKDIYGIYTYSSLFAVLLRKHKRNNENATLKSETTLKLKGNNGTRTILCNFKNLVHFSRYFKHFNWQRNTVEITKEALAEQWNCNIKTRNITSNVKTNNGTETI